MICGYETWEISEEFINRLRIIVKTTVRRVIDIIRRENKSNRWISDKTRLRNRDNRNSAGKEVEVDGTLGNSLE